MFENGFFVQWYKNNGRVFPWRSEKTTAFEVLVTEMLLRQTRAPEVAKIWTQFVSKYPNPESLIRAANATLVEQLKVLGFGVQKAEALKSAALWLVEHHNGQVPNDLESLLKIPHIGQYSARAILSFAFGQKAEIVDTNILRLFSRYFGLNFPPDNRRAPQAWEIARQILPRRKKHVQQHNYGLLDFTADICKSGKPRCDVCPLSSSCVLGEIEQDRRRQLI